MQILIIEDDTIVSQALSDRLGKLGAELNQGVEIIVATDIVHAAKILGYELKTKFDMSTAFGTVLLAERTGVHNVGIILLDKELAGYTSKTPIPPNSTSNEFDGFEFINAVIDGTPTEVVGDLPQIISISSRPSIIRNKPGLPAIRYADGNERKRSDPKWAEKIYELCKQSLQPPQISGPGG